MNEFVFALQRFTLNNSSKNSLVSGTSSADTIKNYAGGVTLSGGKGNDYIYNSTKSNYTIKSSYGYVTIDGGNGNDSIYSYDPNVSIGGGSGKDLISLKSSDFSGVTINGGTGNDTIYGDSLGGGVLYQYAKGDGNDIIYGYTERDSVTISGSDWSTTKSGKNVLINIAGGGKITLVGAVGKEININPSKPSSSQKSAVSQQDVIKKFMKSLDTTNNSGISAVNQAIKAASGGYFTNINDVVDQMIADCQTAGSADTFLKDYCGIDLTNDDTGAITGFDAGGSEVKTASSIVPESGKLNSFTGNSFTVNGLTFQLASFNSAGTPSAIKYSQLTDDTQKYIWQALKTWWAKSALDLIEQSYGDNYTFGSGATVKKIYVGFSDSITAMASTSGWFTDSSREKVNKLSLQINMNKYESLIIGNVDGKMSDKDTYYLDRVLAHELTHAIMYATVNYSDDLPQFLKEGLPELTHGADDDRKSEIEALAKSPYKLKNALIFDSYDSYAAGYMFMRYLAKQSSQHYPLAGTTSKVAALKSKSVDASKYVSTDNKLLTVAKSFANNILDLADYDSSVKNIDSSAVTKDVMIISNQNSNSISAGKGNDTVYGNTGGDTIYGGAGNDLLYGDAGNDIINGGAGDDSLHGGMGRDTLTGGDGNDVFIFGANVGTDVITDYTEGQDKIKIAGASIIGSAISGKDVVLNLGRNNTVRIQNGKDKKITVIDKEGKETTQKYLTTFRITDSSKETVTVSSSIDVIDASTRTTAVNITGNSHKNSITGGSGKDTIDGGAGNDSIIGGKGNDSIFGNDGNDILKGGVGNDILKGGAGSDSLWGGKGNDSLWGDDGADKFIYSSGEGNDIIYNFADDDMLKITGTFSASYNKSKKEIYFKVDSTDKAITLKNFTATSFDINGDTYKISNKKLIPTP
ncbi:MAG: hypothetical protein IKZ53_10490 [Selenomonadaceae bacterium]|nr:hypothetical protein [Selenomonadaceae bacterium]